MGREYVRELAQSGIPGQSEMTDWYLVHNDDVSCVY